MIWHVATHNVTGVHPTATEIATELEVHGGMAPPRPKDWKGASALQLTQDIPRLLDVKTSRKIWKQVGHLELG